MVQGLEFNESSGKGRPGHRFDGTEKGRWSNEHVSGDYRGTKSPVDLEEVGYHDLVSEGGHSYNPGAEWENYSPSGDFAEDEEISHAADVFERMTGEKNNPLEPEKIADGGTMASYTGEYVESDNVEAAGNRHGMMGL
jgi:hypothetical protein